MNTASRQRLRMQTPAGWWRDAFPLGNGAIGAMPYGRIAQERILLNHEKLWYCGCVDTLPDLSDLPAQQRELMKQKKFCEASDLYPAALRRAGYRGACAMTHPAGDLLVTMPVNQPFRHYERILDLTEGVASVAWTDGEIRFTRECFVSRADDLVVLHISADRPGSVTAEFSFAPHEFVDATDFNGFHEPPIRFRTGIRAGNPFLQGTYTEENRRAVQGGREYGILAKIIAGGHRSETGESIRIEGADQITVLTALFVYEDPEAAFERLAAELDSIGADFPGLKRRHTKRHRELYERTVFHLNSDPGENGSSTSNEQLLLDAYGGEAPEELIEKMANYGRYLLISSSRPGGLPSHLQGVWNGDYNPPWNCFYMLNENLEMNYWQALPGNLPEMLLALMDFYTGYLDDFRENARKLYGCGGILVPPLMSPETGLETFPGPWIINWISAGGWLAQHFYNYYEYTQDREMLRNRILPFLKEVADFYEDFLFRDEQGKVVFCPSTSPENWPKEFCALKTEFSGPPRITVNATLDAAVAKELFTHLLNADREEKLYEEKHSIWQELLEAIPPYRINSDGAVAEWIDPAFSDNYFHRHQSHLYPVFPGTEVEKESQPELFRAFKCAVDKRLCIGLGEQTGWSLAHMANINARLGDGDTALECLDILARTCLGKNFFTYHNDYRGMGITVRDLIMGRSTPFQIDANMGWTSAVYEMLLFSNPGFLKLFPALPRRWKVGFLHNLRAHGGISVSLEWKNGTGRALLTADHETDISIGLPDGSWQTHHLRSGTPLSLDSIVLR